MANINTVDEKGVMEMIESGAVFVDVREKEEIDEIGFDIKNMVWVPLSLFDEKYEIIPVGNPIILACKAGVRSLSAAQFLASKGYTNLYNYSEGIVGWCKKGMPTK